MTSAPELLVLTAIVPFPPDVPTILTSVTVTVTPSLMVTVSPTPGMDAPPQVTGLFQLPETLAVKLSAREEPLSSTARRNNFIIRILFGAVTARIAYARILTNLKVDPILNVITLRRCKHLG